MKSEIAKHITLRFPDFFHLWLEERAKEKEHDKCTELQNICMRFISDVIETQNDSSDKKLIEFRLRMSEDTKNITPKLPLEFHEWLEYSAKINGRSKRFELQLRCMDFMFHSQNENR